MSICKYCGKEFNEKSIGGHTSKCKLNPNYEKNINASKQYFKLANEKSREVRKKILKTFECVCPKCGKIFYVTGTQKQFDNGKLKKYCCRQCANSRVFNETSNIKRKETLKQYYSLPEVKEKIHKLYKCKNCGKSFTYNESSSRAYCCKRCKEEWLEKNWKPKIGGYRNGSGRGKSGWYTGIYCDSSWELAFVIYHLDNNLNISRCKEKRYYIFENKKHIYYPDFVTDAGIIEIKGYYTEQVKAKQKQNEDIIIIDKIGITPYLEYVELHYGKDFTYLYDDSKPIKNIDDLDYIWVFKVNESKKQYINAFINKNEFDLYLNNGWLNGRIDNKGKFKEYKSIRPNRKLYKKLSSIEKEKLFSNIIEI